MPKFIIEQYELHAQKYEVEADNEEEAINALLYGEGHCMDNELEYIEPADEYSRDGFPPSIRSVEEV